MEEPMSSIAQPGEILWKELISKGLGTGLIAAIVGALLFKDGSVYVGGVSIPGPIAMGLGAASGSVAADLSFKYILPHIPANQKYEQAEHAAVSVIASGLGTFAASNIIGNVELMPSFAVGAGSYLAGDYAYHKFINRAEGGFML